MAKKYDFEFKDMTFSKDGQLDELIALDRYTVTAFDDYGISDTVVAITDKNMGTKKVGTITSINEDGTYIVKDRFGEEHTIEEKLMQKPLETEPYQLWDRWAKGGASVESTKKLRDWFENELRWLFDGYRYSLGGRIQLMLGQEFVTGVKAALTAFNCFVVRSPYHLEDAKEQFMDVVEVAFYEASIMRRGGGVGLNISTINSVEGSGAKKSDFIFYLDKSHPDYEELMDRKRLGKLDGVRIITDKEEFEKLTQPVITPGNIARRAVNAFNAIDSVDGLFANMKQMVRDSYDGFAVGIDFNGLRERNAIVHGVNGRSSGSASWMELFILIANLLQQKKIDNVDFAEIFSSIVHLIIQGGSRRGALMLICNDDSPQVYKFMQRKKTAGYLSGANISVGISDTFMNKVLTGKDLLKKGYTIDDNEINEALKLWDILIESAWSSAEPGIVWLERYNKESNSWYFHTIICTNPCGEQGLPAFGVCNLGHFVLPRFYDEETNDVNWNDLARAIHIAVRLQDNIIDYTDYFLDVNKEVQQSERRVGIGSMGLGTLLIRKGLRYGSEEGNEFVDQLYSFIAHEAYKESINLAKEKGAFPKYEYDKFIQSGFMQRMLERFPDLDEGLQKYGIRNVTLLTQAPTGSTATYIDNIPLFRQLFGGSTTGIEPYFSWEYWRAGRLGMAKQTVDIAFKYMQEHGIENIEDLPEYFVTAQDLIPLDHVRVQAACQRWTDSSISKTANCPNDYTIEQTDELYLQSYLLGLKGMTIYRDGSRQAQVLATKEEDAKLESHIEAEQLANLKEEEMEAGTASAVRELEVEEIVKNAVEKAVEKALAEQIKKVPSRLFGMREKVKYTAGDELRKAYVQIFVDEEGTPVEVWIQPTHAEDKEMGEALGQMVTQFLRFGATRDNVEQAVKFLKKGKTMMSLPATVGRLIEGVQYGKIEMPAFGGEPKKKEMKLQECPDCGEMAFDKGNCICLSCGSSHCN